MTNQHQNLLVMDRNNFKSKRERKSDYIKQIGNFPLLADRSKSLLTNSKAVSKGSKINELNRLTDNKSLGYPQIQMYAKGGHKYKYLDNVYRPILSRVQIKIFQEINKITKEINRIQQQIKQEHSKKAKLEKQTEDILNNGINHDQYEMDIDQILGKLHASKKHKYLIERSDLKLLATKNSTMERNIERLKLRQQGNLKEILNNQISKKEQLTSQKIQKPTQRKILSQNFTVMGKLQRFEDQLRSLKTLVSDNQTIIHSIDYMQEQIKNLKQRVTALSHDSQNEKNRLLQFIKEQQVNKQLFLEDFNQFHAQYEALKLENSTLKAMLYNRQPVSNQR